MLDKESMGAYFIALIIMMLLVLLSDMGVESASVNKRVD
jgi:O-antigen/teichoic acid export membrane protein